MLRKTIIFTFLMLTSFIVGSCDSDDNTTTNPYAQFEGDWRGTFSGDDGVFSDNYSSTWRATIDENGLATGVIEFNTMTFPFSLEGQIDENGEVSATYYDVGGQAVGTMTGTMNSITASGEWNSVLMEMEGVWEGTKE